MPEDNLGKKPKRVWLFMEDRSDVAYRDSSTHGIVKCCSKDSRVGLIDDVQSSGYGFANVDPEELDVDC